MTNNQSIDSWLDGALLSYQQWAVDGLGRDIRLPVQRLTHKEAKQAILSKLQETVEEARNNLIDEIGEPLLGDFKDTPTPEEYEWTVKIIGWYKARLTSLKTKENEE